MSKAHENREDLYLRELETILRFGTLVNSSLNIETVLDHAMQWAEEFMDATASTVYELEEATGELFVRFARGEKKEPVRGIRLRVGEGVAGHVVETGEPLMIQDAAEDPRFSDRFDRMTGFETRSMICVPLVVRGRPVGALQVINKKSGEAFTGTDLELLTAASQQIAVALENAKLYQRLQRKFQLTEQELLKTQERLIRSERLSAMGHLVQGVAHEIRNPIMTIGGFARRIKTRLNGGDGLARYADIILEETARLETLVQQVHEFAEVLTASLKPNRIEAVFEEIAPRIEAMAREFQVEVRFRIDDDIPLVEMDCTQISRALLNIARNGLEAMQPGGTLDIRILDEGGNLCIRISDTGKGIQEDRIHSVYDPFVTSKTRGGGLGLTMAHQIVMNHNGEIHIESAEERGTSVTIRIPFPSPSPGANAKKEAPVAGEKPAERDRPSNSPSGV
ncbi:MAG: GAF domain-containing protein [Deltaproteobacteria bacterium]|nr:GAF domain-containing protein [Deltaproteobacteria bacterium]